MQSSLSYCEESIFKMIVKVKMTFQTLFAMTHELLSFLRNFFLLCCFLNSLLIALKKRLVVGSLGPSPLRNFPANLQLKHWLFTHASPMQIKDCKLTHKNINWKSQIQILGSILSVFSFLLPVYLKEKAIVIRHTP